MRQVRLEGKTKKGRERIKQSGEIWNVDERWSASDRVLLHSPKTGDWRWVWVVGEDLNFRIVEWLTVNEFSKLETE